MEPKSEEEIPPKEETAVPSASADNSDEQPPVSESDSKQSQEEGGGSEEGDTKEDPATEQEQETKAEEIPAALTGEKVKIRIHPMGGAPGKKTTFSIARNIPFAQITTSLRNILKLPSAVTLFLYLRQQFSPSMDLYIGDLFDCFASKDILHIHYSLTETYG